MTIQDRPVTPLPVLEPREIAGDTSVSEQPPPISDERYRTLFNAMDDGFCIAEVMFDEAGRAVDHRILDANPAFERHTGVKDPIGRPASELVPGGEPFWNEAYGKVVTTGESVRIEGGSDVMNRWFEVFVSRVGPEAHHTVAILFKDVTTRKMAEQSQRHRMEQFATVLNDAPFGVNVIDGDFRIRLVNAAGRPAFGAMTDLIGRDFGEVMHALWPKARADVLVGLFRETLTTG